MSLKSVPATPLPQDFSADTLLQSLAPRQRQILQIVTEEFVAHVKPVGSKKIARDWDLGVSPATIRNDLAHLEHLGLLSKTHTSSGRVPTLLGYRLYVSRLIREQQLSVAKRQCIREQFEIMRKDSRNWLQDATQTLASVSRSLALATELQFVTQRLKHIELIAVQETQVLMVMVMEAGHVQQQMLEVQQGLHQDALREISNMLNETLGGFTLAEMEGRLPALQPPARKFTEAILQAMPKTRSDSGLPIVVQRGLSHMLEAPEFAESRRACRFINIFDSQSRLHEILFDTDTPGQVHVFIAGDGKKEWSDLADVSMILSRYGITEQATGVVGIVGPVRMAYDYNIGAVRFMATLMSAFVRDVYLDDDPSLALATEVRG